MATTNMFQSKDEIAKRRMRSLVTLFEKTDRILSGRPITCKLALYKTDFIAQTIGLNIEFSSSIGPIDSEEDVVRANGINWHEYGHAMFTPVVYPYSKLGIAIRNVGGDEAFNILEDQRIESMLVALYPNMRHYLTAAFVEIIMKRTEQDQHGRPITPDHSMTYLLSHGRRFLGDDVRDAIRGLFGSPELLADFDDVIDRFRLLNLNNEVDQDKAAVLIDRWLDLMKRLPQQQQRKAQQNADAQQHSKAKVTVIDRGQEANPDKELSEKAQEGVENGDDDRSNIDEAKSSGQQGSGEDDSADQEDSDSDDGGESEQQNWRSGHGKGAGTGKGETDHGDPELNEAIAGVLNEIMRDPEVQADLKASRQAMNGLPPKEEITSRIRTVQKEDTDAAGLARRIGRKFEQIVEDQDPGWDRRVSSGRMNVQRVMSSQKYDPDTMFDQWNEGNADAASVEGGLLLDMSGSMSYHASSLSRSAWIIKSAFDRIKSPLTVYAFESGTHVVYEATDKAQPGMFPAISPQGGTVPHTGIVELGRRLFVSKRKKKIFIVMTDGEWSGPQVAEQYINSMNESGVITALVYLDARIIPVDRIDGHGCQIKASIKDLDGLVEFTNSLVKEALRRR